MLSTVLHAVGETALQVFLFCVVFSFVTGIAWVCAVEWARRKDRVQMPERLRPPREPEIDLAKERYEFEARRDSYVEAQMLRRIV